MAEFVSLPQGVALTSIAVSAAAVARAEPAARELPDLSPEMRVEPLLSLPDVDPASEELSCAYGPIEFIEVGSLHITTAEGLGAARGALMAIFLEASVALCLFGLWKVWQVLQ